MNAALLLVPDPLPTAATMLAMAGLLAVLWLGFHHAQPSPGSLAVGTTLIAAGIAIRLLTNATLRKNEAVSAAGPYALCRHPMYVGTLMAAAGVAAALNHGLALGIPVIALLICLWRIRKEEEFLVTNLSGYADYCREVPVFPTPASLGRALLAGRLRAPLSVAQCFRNGEILRLNFYVALISAAAFYLRLSAALVVASSALLVLLAALSFRGHPVGARRSRNDYILPGALGAAMVVLALVT